MSAPPPMTVPGDVASLPAIADFVASAAEAAGLDRRAQHRLRLAVDEIATNIILHGYQESGRRGRIELSAIVDPRMLSICIEDTGPPYDPGATLRGHVDRSPLDERDEGGLGLLLVARGVDEHAYERVAGKNRNRLGVYRTPQARAHDAATRAFRLLAAVPPDWRAHLCAALAGTPYSVRWSDDPQALPGALRRQPVDLLLLGLDLPDMPGEACLRRLRALGRDLPPVVLVHDTGAEARLEACLDEELVLDVLAIRYPAPVLRTRVRRVVERVGLEAELRATHAHEVELDTLRHDFMEIILPLGAALSRETSFEQLMERIVVEAMAICRADGGTLYIKAPDDELRFSIMRTRSKGIALGGATGEPVPHAPLPLRDADTGAPNHGNVATSAAIGRRSINVPNVYDPEAGFDFSGAKEFDRKLGYRTVSCLTVPLIAGGDLLGVLQVLNAQDAARQQVVPFSAYQQQVIESLASQAAIALQNHFLLQEREGLLKLEREMQIGREIQAEFLSALPRIPGWEIASYLQPAQMVSGDFYDAFELADGSFGLIIADVCDKGVGAALFMGLVRSLLRAFAQTIWGRDDTDPAPRAASIEAQRMDWLSRTLHRSVLLTNDYIAHTHRELDMFSTVFFGVLVPESGRLLYINAGHPPVLVAGPGGVRARLQATGPAVGVIPGAGFRVERALVEPGELVLAYTDGVLDARDAAAERFGRARMEALLATAPGSAQAAVDRLVEAVRAHTGAGESFDDISVLAARRDPGPA